MLPDAFSLLRIFIVVFIFAFIGYQATDSDDKYVRVASLYVVLVGVIFAFSVLEGGAF